MSKNNLNMDPLVKNAFTVFMQDLTAPLLGSQIFSVAIKGLTHEDTVKRTFAERSKVQLGIDWQVICEFGSGGYIHDIVGLSKNRKFVIEVKSPMTNHDGVRNKTRNPKHLPKDCSALQKALSDGAIGAYEIVSLIECYGLDKNGDRRPSDGLSIINYERAIKAEYGIKWPTRHDYQPNDGESEVDEILRGLGMTRIAGWRRERLPIPRADICAFIDVALFKMQNQKTP